MAVSVAAGTAEANALQALKMAACRSSVETGDVSSHSALKSVMAPKAMPVEAKAIGEVSVTRTAREQKCRQPDGLKAQAALEPEPNYGG